MTEVAFGNAATTDENLMIARKVWQSSVVGRVVGLAVLESLELLRSRFGLSSVGGPVQGDAIQVWSGSCQKLPGAA